VQRIMFWQCFYCGQIKVIVTSTHNVGD